jgi:hypothetical protein
VILSSWLPTKTLCAFVLAIGFLVFLQGCGEQEKVKPSLTPSNPAFSNNLSGVNSDIKRRLVDLVGGSVGRKQNSWVSNFKEKINEILWGPFANAAVYVTNSIWDSVNSSEKIVIPGGASVGGCTEPSYLSAAMPTTVNLNDFVGMAMDRRLVRCTASGTYTPNILGRLGNYIERLEYLESGLAVNTLGVLNVASGTLATTQDGTEMVIVYEITATTDTTYYDRAIYVKGYDDVDSSGTVTGADTVLFENLMWVRRTTTLVNFMGLEFSDKFDTNGASGTDSVIDTTSLVILKYNVSSGNLAMEFAQDSASSGLTSVSAQPVAPVLTTERFYSPTKSSNAYLVSYDGTSLAAGNGHTSFAANIPDADDSDFVTVSMNYESSSGADTITGTACVEVATQDSIDDDLCTGHTGAIEINTSLTTAQTAQIAYTGLLDYLDGLGFDSTTLTDLSVGGTRTSWLTDGESISVSFSSTASLQTDLDGTP